MGYIACETLKYIGCVEQANADPFMDMTHLNPIYITG